MLCIGRVLPSMVESQVHPMIPFSARNESVLRGTTLPMMRSPDLLLAFLTMMADKVVIWASVACIWALTALTAAPFVIEPNQLTDSLVAESWSRNVAFAPIAAAIEYRITALQSPLAVFPIVQAGSVTTAIDFDLLLTHAGVCVCSIWGIQFD